jgi:hypothetical protein
VARQERAGVDVKQTLRIATVDAPIGGKLPAETSARRPEAWRKGDTSAGFKTRYFKSKTFDPSDTFGAATPLPGAFFAIQSLAFSRLSSVPALSSQTVTEKSAVLAADEAVANKAFDRADRLLHIDLVLFQHVK